MKLLVDLKGLDNLEKYNAHGLIAASLEYSTHNDKSFTLDEIKTLNKFAKANNKIFIVNIDRIIEEEELEAVYNYIDKLLELEIDYFIYSDFAILSYFLKKKLTKKLIYDPKTMITNYYEADFHNSFNSLVAINNELTLSEIKEVVKAKNTMMEVYGFHQMFYSRRALLSNYEKFRGEELGLTDKKLIIEEEKRDHSYPIYESKHGTFIYTSYIYCLFKELSELQDLVFIRVNPTFLKEEKVFQVLDIYSELLEDFSKAEELYEKLKLVDSRIDSGFLYKKSVLLKEGVK